MKLTPFESTNIYIYIIFSNLIPLNHIPWKSKDHLNIGFRLPEKEFPGATYTVEGSMSAWVKHILFF